MFCVGLVFVAFGHVNAAWPFGLVSSQKAGLRGRGPAGVVRVKKSDSRRRGVELRGLPRCVLQSLVGHLIALRVSCAQLLGLCQLAEMFCHLTIVVSSLGRGVSGREAPALPRHPTVTLCPFQSIRHDAPPQKKRGRPIVGRGAGGGVELSHRVAAVKMASSGSRAWTFKSLTRQSEVCSLMAREKNV
jgi:hypothetical protein